MTRAVQVDSALDARLMVAFRGAWGLAIDRGLIAGRYTTRGDVIEEAEMLAQPITQTQAGDVIGRLNAMSRPYSPEILDQIWCVLAGGDRDV